MASDTRPSDFTTITELDDAHYFATFKSGEGNNFKILVTNIFATRDNGGLYFASGNKLVQDAANLYYNSGTSTVYSGDFYSSTYNIECGKYTAKMWSTGLSFGGDLSVNGGDNTKVDIAAGEGDVVDNFTDPDAPTYMEIEWETQTAVTVPTLATTQITYVAISLDNTIGTATAISATINGSPGTAYINFSTTEYTAAQLRDVIVLGRLIHPNLTNINAAAQTPIAQTSIMLTSYDGFDSLGNVNRSGNIYSGVAGFVQIAKSAGTTFRIGTNQDGTGAGRKSPNITIDPSTSPTTVFHRYRNGAGGWSEAAGTTTIQKNYDDNSGTPQALAAGQWTIHRVGFFNNTQRHVVQLGQNVYANLNAAKQALATEVYDSDPSLADMNFRSFLFIRGGATDLTDPADAFFVQVEKLGGTAAGGSITSTTTLQQAYDNSTVAEILTNATQGPLTVQNGTGSDANDVFDGKNIAGTTTFSITGSGALTASSLNATNLTSSFIPYDNGTSLVDSKLSFNGTNTLTFNNSASTLDSAQFTMQARDDGFCRVIYRSQSAQTASLRWGNSASTAADRLQFFIGSSEAGTNLVADFRNNAVIFGVSGQAKNVDVYGVPGLAFRVNGTSGRTEIFSASTSFDAFIVRRSSDLASIIDLTETSSGGGAIDIFDGSFIIDVRLSSNGDSWFNGGDVGVNTTSPGSNFDVVGTIWCGNTASSTTQLRLNSERAWQFEAAGSGASVIQHFRPVVDAKSFKIVSENSSNAVAHFNVANAASSSYITLCEGGGSVGIGFNSSSSHRLRVDNSSTTATIGIYNANAPAVSAGTNVYMTDSLAGSINTGNYVTHRIGRSVASNNAAEIRFYYFGNGSGSNLLELGFYNQEGPLKIDGNGRVSVGGDTDPAGYTLKVQNTSGSTLTPLSINQVTATYTLVRFEGTEAATTSATVSTLTTSGAVQKHLKIDVNGTTYWLAALANPS